MRPLSLGPGIHAGIADLDEFADSALFPEETVAVERAVASRQREFAAGRGLARYLMSIAGLSDSAVPAGPDRAPLWPQGLVGSLSHTGASVACALASTHHWHGLGIDIEHCGAVTADLHDTLFLPRETGTLQQHDAALVFACKEALYKAVYPGRSEYFDFLDVSLVMASEGAQGERGRFQGHCVTDGLGSRSAIEAVSGHWDRVDDHWLAWCTLA